MKRAGALICAILIAVTMMAPAAFAEDNNSSAAAAKTDLEMVRRVMTTVEAFLA